MSKLDRLEKAGAVFTESLSSISDIEKRFTITGTPTIVDSPFGKAITFDGTTDYLITKAKRYLGSSVFNGNFTIGCRFKTDSAGVDYLLSVYDGTNGIQLALNRGTHFGEAGTNILIGKNGASNTNINYPQRSYSSSGLGYNDGAWHNLVITYNSTGWFTHYLDGIDVTDVPTAGSGSGTISDFGQDLTIGARNLSASFSSKFDGSLKDVIIDNRAWSQQEATDFTNGTLFDYEKNVVSEWDMSEVNPQDVGWKGLGNNGTGTGLDSTNIVDGIAGGKAIRFDGSTEYVTVTDSESIRFDGSTQDFTLNIFFKIVPTAGNNFMMTKFDAGTDGYGFMILNGDDLHIRLNTDTLTYSSTGCNDSSWHMATVTVDRDGWTSLYLDAKFGSRKAMSETLATTAPLSICNTLDGTVSNVQIFDKALTNIQIKDLYKRIKL